MKQLLLVLFLVLGHLLPASGQSHEFRQRIGRRRLWFGTGTGSTSWSKLLGCSMSEPAWPSRSDASDGEEKIPLSSARSREEKYCATLCPIVSPL